MNHYLYQRGMFGTHRVKIELQKGTHKAVVFAELGGNVAGAAVLSSIASYLEDNEMEFKVTEENKKYLDFENSAVEGELAYVDYVRLYDGESSITEYVGEDSGSKAFSNLVVAINIIEFEPEID